MCVYNVSTMVINLPLYNRFVSENYDALMEYWIKTIGTIGIRYESCLPLRIVEQNDNQNYFDFYGTFNLSFNKNP